MLNGFTAEHDDKRFSPVGIDIGNRMAESSTNSVLRSFTTAHLFA